MTNQFIAHAEEARTFSDKKGASKAIKRDLSKHWDAHGDVLYETGTEPKQTPDGRWGVVVFVDLTPVEAQTKVGEELSGYVIEPQRKEAVKPKPVSAMRRRSGEVNVAPMEKLVPARANSVQQKMIVALSTGATMDDLRKVCQKKDGSGPWEDNSIRSGMYFDVHQKGYGVSTTWVGLQPTYRLVLPEGYETFLPPRGSKS